MAKAGHLLLKEGHPSLKAGFYRLKGKAAPMPFSRKDFYKIWLIHNKGLLRLPDQEVVVNRPALAFFTPTTPYAYGPWEKERTGYWCVFNESFLLNDTRLENLQGSSLFKPNAGHIIFPNKKQLDVITFLFERIVDDFNSSYVHRYQSIRHYIHLLLHEGIKTQPAAAAETAPHNAAARIATQFLDLLEKQFPIESPQHGLQLKKPGDYAQALSVHVNHLNAVVQEVTGQSTSAHIAGKMLSEAKALLTYSSWSVADIADALGFEYPNHFSNFFKKHTGVTPLSLRR